MSDFSLTLGGVEFRDFEIPDSISGGGAQVFRTHKYAGGKRNLDAFGPDAAPIRWEGVFLDGGAEARCQQIDAMRAAGVQVELSWSSYNYVVVIAEFLWKYEKFYRIPYAITLEVVQDNAQAGADAGDDPENVIQGDLDDTFNFSESLGDSGLSALTDTLSGMVNSVPSITGAAASFLAGFSSQIADTLDYVGGMSDISDIALDAIPVLVSGGNPENIAAELLNAASESQTMATTFALNCTLGRLQKNVAAITG